MRYVLFIALILSAPLWAAPIDVLSTEPHRVRVIETGIAALQQRLELIESAQQSIDVEYFIYDDSYGARIFTEALVRKRVENPEIKIRILIDWFSLSKSLDPYYATALIDSGIEVRYYNSAFLFNFGKITHRNHRKVLLVDGGTAIVGGRNTADEYFDLKEKHNFMDRDVWVQGPITKAIGESFEYFWNSQYSTVPSKPRPPIQAMGGKGQGTYQAERLRHERRLWYAARFAQPFSNSDEKGLVELREKILKTGQRLMEAEPFYTVNKVRFVADGEDFKDKTHSITGPRYYELLRDAKSHVMIETPYFYLQKAEKEAFEDLRSREVKVQLLLNSKRASNEFAINYISLLQGLDFSRMGFDLYLNKGNFMTKEDLVTDLDVEDTKWMVHAKTMLVDSQTTWIGTLNMDPRSIQRMNAEMALVVEDEAFAERVKGHVQRRLDASYTVINGKIRKDEAEEDPSQLDGLWEEIKSLSTKPFYWFENQI